MITIGGFIGPLCDEMVLQDCDSGRETQEVMSSKWEGGVERGSFMATNIALALVLLHKLTENTMKDRFANQRTLHINTCIGLAGESVSEHAAVRNM
jgi:hypothetical protein